MGNPGNAGEESREGCDGPHHHLPRWGGTQRLLKRWKNFAPDIAVDRGRMAQNVLRYNVVIVGKFFNKGSWVSEAWRKEHPEEFADKVQGPPERMETTSERKERLHLVPVCEGAVCVRPSGTPPPHGVRLTPAGRGNPNLQVRGPINQHN